jgi:hypothetical protein
MLNKTQVSWVKENLRENGYISRNQCLRNYISRLGAIINILKKDGWRFEANYQQTVNGKDFWYKLVREGK